jgi:hypothetical protein
MAQIFKNLHISALLCEDGITNKTIPHADLPPFDPTKSCEIYTAESSSSLVITISAFCLFVYLFVYSFFKLLIHSLIQNILLDTQVCFRVPFVHTLCTSLEWLADNAEITSHP